MQKYFIKNDRMKILSVMPEILELKFQQVIMYFFLDDDDKINNRFILWLERNNLNKAIYRFKFLRKNEINNPLFKIWKLTKNDLIQPSTYLLNKKFLEKNNIWWEENTISEDSFFASLISKTGVKQQKINIASIYYNEVDFSIIRQEKKQSINRDLKPLKLWIQKDLSKYDTSFIFSLFRYVLWLKKTSFIEGDAEAEKILRIFFINELIPILNEPDFSGKYKRKYRKYLINFKNVNTF